MIIKGFKFGMLLQIAVGPICLFVFQTAAAHGFTSAMSGVIGVTLIDALYILAAICGLGTLIEHYKNFKNNSVFWSYSSHWIWCQYHPGYIGNFNHSKHGLFIKAKC